MFGISPIMFAAMNGNTAAVNFLLDMGSDVNEQIETNKNTALTLACSQGHHEVVSLLVDRKANIEHRARTGLTPLMEAASGGHVEVGRVLVDKGANVNAPPVPSSRDTALTIAADKGHFGFVDFLLSRSAEVDAKNKKGNSPLWLACNGGHLNVVQLLVSAHADIDSQDNRKVSCLMAAFRKGHVTVIEWIVKRVNQFPTDQELSKCISSAEDKELKMKCQQSEDIIVFAKGHQAEEAKKNGSNLLEDLDKERETQEKKRSKKREKKRQKKKEKQEKEKDTTTTGPPEGTKQAHALNISLVSDPEKELNQLIPKCTNKQPPQKESMYWSVDTMDNSPVSENVGKPDQMGGKSDAALRAKPPAYRTTNIRPTTPQEVETHSPVISLRTHREFSPSTHSISQTQPQKDDNNQNRFNEKRHSLNGSIQSMPDMNLDTTSRSERDRRVLPNTDEERFVHDPKEKLQNAKKEIAWEWFMQAETDLESGKAVLRGINIKPYRGYYAVCLHCHEAVEKGVKAVKYAANAEVLSTHIFRDNIPRNDDSLLSDCDELHKLIGTLKMMRYPCDNLIPADRYTPNQAEEALRLTEKILRHVSETYL